MEIPQTGGTFVRDPRSGKLERQTDHTAEAPVPAPTEDGQQPVPEVPGDEPTNKKVK